MNYSFNLVLFVMRKRMQKNNLILFFLFLNCSVQFFGQVVIKGRSNYKTDLIDVYEVSDFITNTEQKLLTVSEGNNVTVFNLKNLTIKGGVSAVSVSVKDQLRRNGIRFRYEPIDGVWTSWIS